MRVEVAEPPWVSVMLAGLKATLGPPVTTGDTVNVRLIVPVNPLRLFRVSVDMPDPPAVMATEDGLAEILKSFPWVTVTATVMEWDRDPLSPLTTTL